ncbi:MAG: AzlC family ABC transporter permease [Syntrophomonadaceae bacterium]|nr:AzlC family ABC transporter permease [Syntrophomonadaceae bacterium]
MNRAEIITGIRDSIPIILGYLPLGFAFGVLATQAGMTIIQATVMSILCFTGAGQYIALGVMQAGGAVLTAIMANILVNLRYFLFATSMVPHLRNHVPIKWASILSYGLTDETYAVAMNHYRNHEASTSYMAALNLSSHFGWITSTLLGAFLGANIADTDRLGLGFALPAMYICLLILVINKRNDILAAVIAAVLCIVIGLIWPSTIHNMSNIIVASVVAATIGVLVNE